MSFKPKTNKDIEWERHCRRVEEHAIRILAAQVAFDGVEGSEVLKISTAQDAIAQAESFIDAMNDYELEGPRD